VTEEGGSEPKEQQVQTTVLPVSVRIQANVRAKQPSLAIMTATRDSQEIMKLFNCGQAELLKKFRASHVICPA